jgi:protein-disulfide isomerase
MMDRRPLPWLALGVIACNHATAAPLAPPPPPPIAVPAPVVAAPPPMPSEEDAAVPIAPGDPTWGSRLAPVTLVEFADFQCPFSLRLESTLAAVREAYGPEKIRIVWKNLPLPFHKNAQPAAEAAMGVFALGGNDAFWKFHDLAFENQTALAPDAYAKWAQQAGVGDVASYTAGIESHQWAFGVERGRREAGTLGASATPTLFINGIRVVGAQPLDTIQPQIDKAIAQADADVASGTPRERVYAKAAGDNFVAVAEKAADEKETDTQTVFKVPTGKSPARGPASALVTVIEFGDFQCPFTGRVEATLGALRARYGDKLRLVWKDNPLPFHPAAEPAAEAALEVRAEKGDAAFWDAHDRLFAAQKTLVNGSAPDLDAIAALAVAAGGDATRVKKAIADRTHQKEIEADQNTVEDFVASGTPYFFIDGRRLQGAQPQEKFEKIIDEEIVRAEALVKSGTKPADLYAALTRDGRPAPEPESKEMPAGLPADDPAIGPASARVSIHEWADFQCPFCKRVDATLQQIVTTYGNRVRIVWHDLPLPMHVHAALAAQAAREAYAQKGAHAFWAIHDKMYSDQTKLTRDDLDADAREQNLDMTRWAAVLDGDGHRSAIEADKTAGNAAGVKGTPGFIIVPAGATKGYWVSGAQTFARFKRLVDRAMTEAK